MSKGVFLFLFVPIQLNVFFKIMQHIFETSINFHCNI